VHYDLENFIRLLRRIVLSDFLLRRSLIRFVVVLVVVLFTVCFFNDLRLLMQRLLVNSGPKFGLPPEERSVLLEIIMGLCLNILAESVGKRIVVICIRQSCGLSVNRSCHALIGYSLHASSSTHHSHISFDRFFDEGVCSV